MAQGRVNVLALEQHINTLLTVERFRDYAPNGLQVEGRAEVRKVVTGVTACQQLLDAAVAMEADAVLVHHGYFWKHESPVIRGMKKRRLQTLLQHDISLLGYHLPLDAHPELGNNAQLARLLGLQSLGLMDEEGVGNIGVPETPLSLEALGAKVSQVLGREPVLVSGGTHPVQRIAWCTGGAQGYIDQAHELGADTYLSGEISEQTVHSARENGVHYIAAGHHATERYGVQALGAHLTEHFGLECVFVDVDSPA